MLRMQFFPRSVCRKHDRKYTSPPFGIFPKHVALAFRGEILCDMVHLHSVCPKCFSSICGRFNMGLLVEQQLGISFQFGNVWDLPPFLCFVGS